MKNKVSKKKAYKIFLVSLISLIIMDSLWLFFLAGDVYSSLLVNFPAPDPMPVWAVFGVWILLALGIVYFVLPLIKKTNESLVHGAVYGVVIYGVFELTNYAILAGWSLEMVIIDVIWGAVLCSVNTYLTYKYSLL